MSDETTRPPYEALSRLKSGHLPPSEASALTERMDREPALSEAAEQLDALVDLLQALPEEAPPPGLDDRVLRRAAPPSPARGVSPPPAPPEAQRGPLHSLLPWAMTVLATAAAVLLALRPAPEARVIVASGDQVVEGHVRILAEDVAIDLDGQARITVEPILPPAREPTPEAPMKVVLSSLGGAVGGAIVTVMVLEGRALVTSPEGEAVALAPGDRQVIAPPRAALAGLAPITETPPSEDPRTLEALEAENAQLRQQLAEAQFSSAVARGQVARSQGDPSPWPADLDPAWAPAAFEQHLRAEVAKIPGLELQQLDCEEFPCVATLLAKDLGDDWQKKLEQLPDNLTSTHYPDSGVWMGLANHKAQDGSNTVGVSLALLPEAPDEAVRTRTDFRAGTLLKELQMQVEE